MCSKSVMSNINRLVVVMDFKCWMCDISWIQKKKGYKIGRNFQKKKKKNVRREKKMNSGLERKEEKNLKFLKSECVRQINYDGTWQWEKFQMQK